MLSGFWEVTMESLVTMQKVAKAGKILSRIIFVICIVGAALCALSLVFYLVIGDRNISIGGISIYGMIQQETGVPVTPALLCTSLGCAVLTCIAEIILSQKAVTYFRHELETGTPFTFEGARELKKLGFWAMFLPLGVSLICSIALLIAIHQSWGPLTEADSFRITFSTGSSFGIGIAMLIFSSFCKSGAQFQQNGTWPQYTVNQQWNPNQQWTQQNQMNQQWTNQQNQMNQQWTNQQNQMNQQWYSQQNQANQQWYNQQNTNQQWGSDRQDPPTQE